MEDDPFDPITEIDQVSVVVDVEDPERGPSQIRETVTQRRITHQTLRTILQTVEELEAVEWFGALDVAVPFDNEKAAWRMVPVLRRRR